jgi:signal transduction histidine kinase
MDQATSSILKVARSVLEQLDVDIVLKRVLESARELTGARYAALGVLSESRTELARFLTRGIDERSGRLIGPPPTGRGVLGELIRDPKSLRLADVGSHPYSYGFPVDHPPMASFLGVPILVAGQPYGNLYLTEKQTGGEFSDADQEAVELLAQFAGLAIDHARRFATSETQRTALERTVGALNATMQITRALGGQTDLDAILELVAKRGRALVSARALVIELLRDDELELAAGAGELPAALLGQRVRLENTVASAALRARQSQRLSDELNRSRFEQHGLGHLGLSAENGLVVPLVFRDRPYGVLVAIDHLDPGEFTDDDQSLLEAFAASAAIAVATAQSAADERRQLRLAATEAERTRWARELHDETLQALGNLRLVLSGAKRSGDPRVMSDAIAQALDQLEHDIGSLRALITELRPAALDQLGLEPAVLALVDRARSPELEVDVSIELTFEHQRSIGRLAPDLETGVYRTVQEALNNVIKHSTATRAVVELLEGDQFLWATVRDNGHGFDTDATTSGFGLLGMRERVELLSGKIAIVSSPGEGTTMSAQFPVRRRTAEPAAPVLSGRKTAERKNEPPQKSSVSPTEGQVGYA